MKDHALPVSIVFVIAFALLFYVFSPGVLTLIYAVASFLTFVFLVCMVQGHLRDSTAWFRGAMLTLAAGCLVTTFTPFLDHYTVGPWELVKSLGLLAGVLMMRLRQVRRSVLRPSGPFVV